MNIRNAILMAADSIEKYPSLFDFMSNEKPNLDCGTPGCVLGWIGFYLGIDAELMPTPTGQALDCPKMTLTDKCTDSVMYEDWGFYRRMNDVSGHSDWRDGAPACVAALHKYADRYFPACDNRLCCNPSHLSLGTGRENVLDAQQKRRYKHNGSKSGSENNAAILVESDVAEIKFLIGIGITQPEIAKNFGTGDL